MILVVGATGQLGAAIVRKLVERRMPTRALVRATSDHSFLKRDGVEIVTGDLRDRDSLVAACRGIETVIATANSALPRRGDSFDAVDGTGYANLIAAAKENGVKQFIYTSALSTPMFDSLPIGRQKRITEKRLEESGLVYTIFRADAFMDVAFPMMGSDIPLRGSERATIARPFWFTSKFFDGVRNSMAEKDTALIAGDGTARHSYVCIDDLAEFHVNAVGLPEARNGIFKIGGPQAISQNDIVAIFEKVLGKPLKRKSTPPIAFKLGSIILRPFSPAAANIMGINYHSATTDSIIEMEETAKLFNVKLTSAEDFIRRKSETVTSE